MAEKLFTSRIKHKRDTATNWKSRNPVLLDGEIILVEESDGEIRLKCGDGVSTYSSLPFLDEGLQAGINAKAAKSTGVFYIEGTGDTAGAWLGSHSDITEYYAGLMIAYKIGIAGVSSGTTLNINSLGAVPVVRNTTSSVTTHYGVGAVLFLVYTVDSDGNAYWKISDYDSDTKARSSNKTGTKLFIIGAAAQSSSGQTTYSNTNCYIGTDNCLYSGGEQVATSDSVIAAIEAALANLNVGFANTEEDM